MTCCQDPSPVLTLARGYVLCRCGTYRPDARPREALARLLAALDESNHWLMLSEAATHARRVLEETT